MKKATQKFAKQDLKLAQKNGVCCITGTKVGNVEICFEDGKFEASNFNNGNQKHTGWITFDEMVDWLSEQYVIA